MKLHCFLFFLFSVFYTHAQEKLSLSIDLTQEFEPLIGASIWTGTGIVTQQGFVPVYVKQWKKESSKKINNVTFSNVKVKTLKITELGAIDQSFLSSSFNPSLRIVKERNTSYYSVVANAMYKNDKGEVLQVESFDVQYSLNPVSRVPKQYGTKSLINSVLSSGTWYKIAIDKTGVFKLDANFLKSIGINTSLINPKHIKVYGNGGAMLPELLSDSRKEDLTENAIFVSGENDNVFNDNDYVLFYAQGPISWDLKSRSDIKHKQNIYSNYGYYFINVDSGTNGKRITNLATVTSPATKTINSFTDYAFHEKELHNYIRVGRRWFGEDFSVTNNQDFVFNFPNIVTTENVDVTSVFSTKTGSNSTSYTVLYNNTTSINYSFLASGSSAFRDKENTYSFLPNNDNISLNINWNNGGDLSAQARLDYLEVVADRYLTANGKQFGFINFNSQNNGDVLEYVLSNDTAVDFVWNVTDHCNPTNVIDTDLNSSNFKFKEVSDATLDKYHVIKVSDAYAPIKLSDGSNVANQNLHALQDVQYLIVTTNELRAAANRIANYHRNNTTISETNNDNLHVEVISLEQIYNEFGSGSPDITAIRDFAKYLYDNGSSDETSLKYLCLFGDTSFDYKGIIYKNTQMVPSYQSTNSKDLINSYVSDDYYAYLDVADNTNEGKLNTSGMLDIVTGRIPVSTLAKANQYVTKLLNYYSPKSFGSWKNKVTLLGDDGQEGSDQSLIKSIEDSSLILEANKPTINVSKLYTDAFKEEISSGGGSYPEINKKFLEAFNLGSVVINYFGHGNVFNLGEESYLDISRIRSLRNLNTLPLFITVTCDFSRFDDPTIVSAGEELIQGAYGGAVSMITTSREIFVFSGRTTNNSLADFLYSFDGKTRTAAEALKDSKNRDSFKGEFFVFFFGDPAMRLSLPKEGIDITKVEKYVVDSGSGNSILNVTTELNGLSKVKVTGEVTDNGVVKTDFNGILYVSLFDKEIDRQTLLNEAVNSGGVYDPNKVVHFKSLESKVFVGEVSVKNGKFSFDFILPKDVSSLPENAKFSFYAASDKEERVGSDFSYKVGGIDPNAPEDNTPPVIQLYIGDETFIDGGTTSTSPKLLAKINDASGVNTSLNSIGHNITVVVDGDLANPISLNEYYTTEKNDFTKGIVRYELPELSPGNHTLTFKAWDSYNNSSTQTLSFYAQEDKGFKISKVLNYPNPFINHTEFWFKNNRQGEPLKIMVKIYTLSGKLIKTISESDINLGEISRVVTWDGKDDFGNRIGKGVYIYKLIVKEINSGQSDERVEKLVIL